MFPPLGSLLQFSAGKTHRPKPDTSCPTGHYFSQKLSRGFLNFLLISCQSLAKKAELKAALVSALHVLSQEHVTRKAKIRPRLLGSIIRPEFCCPQYPGLAARHGPMPQQEAEQTGGLGPPAPPCCSGRPGMGRTRQESSVQGWAARDPRQARASPVASPRHLRAFPPPPHTHPPPFDFH